MVIEQGTEIYAEVVARSRTGASLLTDAPRVMSNQLFAFQSSRERISELSRNLESAGFRVIASSPFGVSIVGPAELYREYFQTEIVERPVEMFFGGGRSYESNTFAFDQSPTVPGEVSNLAETVYIPRKGELLSGEGAMPNPPYYHLSPPDDIVRLTNAAAAHSRGYRGTGVKVAMLDSGFILNHDYYAGRGYHITVDAAIGDVNQDEYGHGTGIASSLLAIAPNCDFHFIKMIKVVNGQETWAQVAAFRMAVAAGAKVISCSWTVPRDPVFEAEIISAISSGINVIIACGNGGPVGWPSCIPEVLSVGGAYPRQDGSWEASSYASSGVNYHFPTRHCPDLSGITGQSPRGILIVSPTMRNAIFDQSFSGSTFPNGDQTGPSDGWMVASGTSSATPMVAGAAALLLEAKSSLTPAQIKQTLADTCRDVTTGKSASGEAAGVGADSATGSGMIDIGTAVNKVAPILRCPPAPFHCTRAPIWRCPPAPFFKCPPAPLIPICPPSPVIQCLAGPIRDPFPPEETPDPIRERTGQPATSEKRYVPVVILMDEQEAEQALVGEGANAGMNAVTVQQIALQSARKAYYLTMEALGLSEEYADFPGVEGGGNEFDPNMEA